jgi:hypothetical protein
MVSKPKFQEQSWFSKYWFTLHPSLYEMCEKYQLLHQYVRKEEREGKEVEI